MSNRQLYPHQMRALSMLRDSLASGKRRPIVAAPTAFGKTVVMSTMTRGAVLKGNNVIITVPGIQLVDQTLEKLASEGITQVGVMQGNHPLTDASQPVQVATVQTLARRQIPKAAMVLVDECHVQFEFQRRWMADPAWARVPFIGFSATPWSRGLGKMYDDLVIPATTKELIETVNPATGRTFLSPFKAFAPPSGLKPDLSGVKVMAGDYHEGQLADEMSKPHLTADVVATWLQLARGRPTLVFAVNRAHAEALFEQFHGNGVRTAYIDGNTPLVERDQIRDAMARGEIEVTINIGCLTTGCDWPFISCISLARPTRSEMLFVQIIGRGLRDFAGKDYCLVLDHTDTHQRLGLVTDIHHTTLCDGKHAQTAKRDAKPKEVLPKECSKCHHIKPPATAFCPNCGHEARVFHKVVTEDGELVEYGKKSKAPTMADKQAFWSSIIGYAQIHLKTHKWCLAQYRQKFGVWPRGLHDIGTEPAPEVCAWVKSRNIAFSKARGKRPS